MGVAPVFEPPPGLTEAEVLEAIEHVVRVVCGTFGFGYYDREDIEQEARLLALKGLAKYEQGKGGLKDFLWVHTYWRLLNLQRDKLMRATPPCKLCHQNTPCEEGAASDYGFCARYRKWLELNSAKAGLMQPAGFSEAAEARHADRRAKNGGESAEAAEIWRKVDAELPLSLRADYLRLREGVSLGKARTEAVLAAIREILGVDLEVGDG